MLFYKSYITQWSWMIIKSCFFMWYLSSLFFFCNTCIIFNKLKFWFYIIFAQEQIFWHTYKRCYLNEMFLNYSLFVLHCKLHHWLWHNLQEEMQNSASHWKFSTTDNQGVLKVIDMYDYSRVNCYNTVTPQTPFGGYKQSGIGREMWV